MGLICNFYKISSSSSSSSLTCHDTHKGARRHPKETARLRL